MPYSSTITKNTVEMRILRALPRDRASYDAHGKRSAVRPPPRPIEPSIKLMSTANFYAAGALQTPSEAAARRLLEVYVSFQNNSPHNDNTASVYAVNSAQVPAAT